MSTPDYERCVWLDKDNTDKEWAWKCGHKDKVFLYCECQRQGGRCVRDGLFKVKP